MTSYVLRALALALPAATFFLVARSLRGVSFSRSLGDRLLLASVAVACWLTLSTEALSALGRIDRRGISSAWLLALVLAIALAAFASMARRGTMAQRDRPSPSARWTAAQRMALAALTLLAATLGAIALLSHPSTGDVVAYHLPRVARWIQQGSLAHAPVSDLRQLDFPPFTEMTALHSILLWGSDRFVQLAGWIPALGATWTVYALAAELGVRRNGQLCAAIFFATLPMTVLQAPSMKNDLMVTFWILVAAWAVLRAGPRVRAPWPAVALVAAGLALATKSLAFFYLPPLGLLLIARRLDPAGRKEAGAPVSGVAAGGSQSSLATSVFAVLIAGALACALITPHAWRNLQTFDSPLGSTELREMVVNDAFGPRIMVSTALRTASSHTTALGLEGLRPWVERGVRGLHDRVLRLSEDDPRTTFLPYGHYSIEPGALFEEATGAAWHLLLACATLIFLAARLFARHRRPAGPPEARSGTSPESLGLALALSTAALAGSALLFATLRWHPWMGRFTLPLFALLAPVVGLAAQSLLSRSTRSARLLVVGLAGALLLTALPATFLSRQRPVFDLERGFGAASRSILVADPTTQLFAGRPELKDPVIEFTSRLRASTCRSLALRTVGHDPEYSVWRLLNGPARTTNRFRIEHIQVKNSSARALGAGGDPGTPFEPCAFLDMRGRRVVVRQAPWLTAAP